MKKMERPLFTGNAFKFDIAMLNVLVMSVILSTVVYAFFF